MFKRILSTLDAGAHALVKYRPVLREPEAPPALEFRAVSIVPRLPACKAAQGCGGKRMLLKPNTRLPLRDCSMPDQCSCRFNMHDDRRQGERRSESVTWARVKKLGIDRRVARGRRATDLDATADRRAASRPRPS